mgnify:CR=1 FL=1
MSSQLLARVERTALILTAVLAGASLVVPRGGPRLALGVAGVTVLGLLPNLWYAFVAHPDIWAMLAGR